jgi:hypothetical protein
MFQEDQNSPFEIQNKKSKFSHYLSQITCTWKAFYLKAVPGFYALYQRLVRIFCNAPKLFKGTVAPD